MDPASNPSYPGNGFSNTYRFGFNSRVEMGSYPVYPTNWVNKKIRNP